MIQLDNFAREVMNQWEKFDFKYEREDNSVRLTASITANQYEDDIFFEIVCYEGGTLHVFFTFDKIDVSMSTLSLVNSFNDSNPWFSAAITKIKDNHYLKLHHSVLTAVDEDHAAGIVTDILNELISDTVVKHLLPLTKMTY